MTNRIQKHAFLILIHQVTCTEQLIEQLGGGYSERVNIYIHVDKKAYSAFSTIMAKYESMDNIHFFSRYNIHWGGIQMVDAEKALLEYALKDEDNFYFHLLSGVDFLCRPLNELFDFFDNKENQYKEYIECVPVNAIWSDERIRSRFFCWNIHDLIDTRKWHLGLLNRYLSHMQWFLHIRRKAFPYPVLMGGSQWWSLSLKGAQVLFEAMNDLNIRKRFCYTYAPDELFASTVIGNSDLSLVNEKCLQNKEEISENLKCMRYTPWWKKEKRGIHPLALTDEDYALIKSSGAFFCRKIDLKHSKNLINKLIADHPKK